MAGICLPLGLCKGTVSGLWKTLDIPTSHEPTIHCDWSNSCLYSDQPVAKRWCQWVKGNVSYFTDSPNATRPGLWNSLDRPSPEGKISADQLTTHLFATWWFVGAICFLKYSRLWNIVFLNTGCSLERSTRVNENQYCGCWWFGVCHWGGYVAARLI